MDKKKISFRTKVITPAVALFLTGTTILLGNILSGSKTTLRLSSDKATYTYGETVVITCKLEAIAGGYPYGATADLNYDNDRFVPVPESMTSANPEFWAAEASVYFDEVSGTNKVAILGYYLTENLTSWVNVPIIFTIEFVVTSTESIYPNHFTLDNVEVGGKRHLSDPGFKLWERTECYGVAVRIGN